MHCGARIIICIDENGLAIPLDLPPLAEPRHVLSADRTRCAVRTVTTAHHYTCASLIDE